MSNDSYLTIDTVDITIDGAPIAQEYVDNLTRAMIELSWSAADRAMLEFRSEDFDFPGKVGQAMEVRLVRGGEPQSPPMFKGKITGVGLRYGSEALVTVVEALDDRHLLTRKIEPKTYENQKLGDIVADIASTHGLQTQADLGPTKFEHFIMADSHFAVLQYIARRTGTVWTLDDKTIRFSEPGTQAGPALTLEAFESDLIDLELRFSPTELAKEVSVNGWDQAQGKAIVGRAESIAVQKGKIVTMTKPPEVDAVAWGGGAHDAEDAANMAKAIDRRLRTADVVGRGTALVQPTLVPGKVIELKGIGDDFAGEYVISDVVHRFGSIDGSATTEFRIGPPDMSLDQLLGDGDRIGGRAPEGVTIGIVTESKDPDRLGRVRVKLPLLSDQLQTGWIRTASVGSGTDRGIVFVPEVNDEVLVAFEHGELNRPYVIGALWNKPGKAFDGAANENKTDERRLVSRLGSAIRFVDKASGDATSGISIEMDGAKTKIFMGYKQVTIETQGRPLEIKNGKASIKMDNDDITITANNITIDAKQNIEVKSSMDTTIKAGKNATVEATSQLNAKSNAGTTVESSAITTVKGSMVQVN